MPHPVLDTTYESFEAAISAVKDWHSHKNLEFDLDYVEFPPVHYTHNIHCKLSAKHFNKPYYVSNYFKRNKQIAEYSNILIAFIQDGVESKGTMNTVGYAKKLKKMVKIIN